MLFADRDRDIFCYQNHKGEVRADPLTLRRRLSQAALGDVAALVAEATKPDPEGPDGQPVFDAGTALARLDGEERLLAAVRYAFELPPVDPKTGEGCTEAMCWRVWDLYGAYIEGELRPVESSRPSAPPTGSRPADSTTGPTCG